MADPFATSADIEARWRPLSDAESALADQLAEDASDMIRERWGDIDVRVTSGAISANTLTRIVAKMVKRSMDRPVPDGFETFNQAAGPFSTGGKVANPTGDLSFTAADVLVLDGTGFTTRSRVGWLA